MWPSFPFNTWSSTPVKRMKSYGSTSWKETISWRFIRTLLRETDEPRVKRWTHSCHPFLFLTVDRLFILGLEAIHLSLRTEIGAVCWKEFYSWMKRFLPRSINKRSDRGERNLWIKNNSFPFPWAWSRSDSAWGAQAQEKEGNVHPWRRET